MKKKHVPFNYLPLKAIICRKRQFGQSNKLILKKNPKNWYVYIFKDWYKFLIFIFGNKLSLMVYW